MKFVECLFAATAFINALLMLVELLPPRILTKLGRNFFSYLLLGQTLLGLLFAVAYSVYWQRKEIKTGSTPASCMPG